MIETRTVPDFAALAAQLVETARTLAEARAQMRTLDNRQDPLRWRSARLLWPLFTKG